MQPMNVDRSTWRYPIYNKIASCVLVNMASKRYQLLYSVRYYVMDTDWAIVILDGLDASLYASLLSRVCRDLLCYTNS